MVDNSKAKIEDDKMPQIRTREIIVHVNRSSAIKKERPKRIGKNSNVFASLLLPNIIFSVYSSAWIYKIFIDADFFGEEKINTTSDGAAVGFLFFTFFNFFWMIMRWIEFPDLLSIMQQVDGVTETQITNYSQYGRLIFIPIFGALLWVFLSHSPFNDYWEEGRIVV